MNSLEQLVEKNIFLFEQLLKVNSIANEIYEGIYGHNRQNFINLYSEYESGVIGWIKEYNVFCTAVKVHEYFTANDSWDLVLEAIETFGEYVLPMSYKELRNWESKLEDKE